MEGEGVMDIENAVKLLQVHYDAAKKLEWVHNPVAYALYEVWKMADRKNGKGR